MFAEDKTEQGMPQNKAGNSTGGEGEPQGSILPPVSVIIPTYNRASFLTGALDSVLGQSHTQLELVVVDDGSDDNTEELVRELATATGREIRFLRQPNRGPAAARNTGIRAARHDLLAFLDSDDRFAPEKLARQVAAMEENPHYLVCHTGERWVRRGQHLNQKKNHKKTGGFIFPQCLKLCCVGMSTVMVRRIFFEKIGLFDETLPCCEDYDLWLRASPQLPFLLVDEPLTVKHGGRPDQVSVRLRQGMDRYRIKALDKLLLSGKLLPWQRQLALAELASKCSVYGNGCRKHGRPNEAARYLALPARHGWSRDLAHAAAGTATAGGPARGILP